MLTLFYILTLKVDCITDIIDSLCGDDTDALLSRERQRALLSDSILALEEALEVIFLLFNEKQHSHGSIF